MLKTKYIVAFIGIKCRVWVGRYEDNALALVLISEETGERVAVATVFLQNFTPEPGNVILKSWSENMGIDLALWGAGVIERYPVNNYPTGFCIAYEFALTEDFKTHLNELKEGVDHVE